MDQMLAATRDSGQLEAGGILVGRYEQEGQLAVITDASTKTSDARAGRTWLHRGTAGLRKWLAKLWCRRQGHYVGEWHSHPFASPQPSATDLRQMQSVAASAIYSCREPILVIIGGNAAARHELSVHVVLASGATFKLSALYPQSH
ncbi:MAG: Mov34/MPN/PAD-1 family protein [Planctomycetota bacterium]|jgi:integrative and conjugative element protein (TIGR02256 family)